MGRERERKREKVLPWDESAVGIFVLSAVPVCKIGLERIAHRLVPDDQLVLQKLERFGMGRRNDTSIQLEVHRD